MLQSQTHDNVCVLECTPLPNITNGYMNVSDGVDGVFTYNSEATFSCSEGFNLSHSFTLQCSGQGVWTHNQPICKSSNVCSL